VPSLSFNGDHFVISILNPETGASFRECILSKGNSLPADELYHNFMGRDPDQTALLQRAGLL